MKTQIKDNIQMKADKEMSTILYISIMLIVILVLAKSAAKRLLYLNYNIKVLLIE